MVGQFVSRMAQGAKWLIGQDNPQLKSGRNAKRKERAMFRRFFNGSALTVLMQKERRKGWSISEKKWF